MPLSGSYIGFEGSKISNIILVITIKLLRSTLDSNIYNVTKISSHDSMSHFTIVYHNVKPKNCNSLALSRTIPSKEKYE